METVKNVLIPVDGSDHSKKALKKGVSLARLVSAEVTVMYVSEKILIFPLSVISIPDEKLRGLLNESVNNLLNYAKKECRKTSSVYNRCIK